MELGGRAVEGSETGWSQPAEPAPRWRALLDRARLGSRGAEPAGPDRSGPAAPAEPLPRRAAGNGYAARVPAAGSHLPGPGSPPAELAYDAEARTYGADPRDAGHRGEPAYRAERGLPAEPAYGAAAGYRNPLAPGPEPRFSEPESPPVQSRYALLDNGYRHAPPVENGYRHAPPAENGYQSDSAYRSEPGYRSEPAYQADPGYRSEHDYRSEPVYRSEPAGPADPGYRSQPAYPSEPAYQPAVNRGYARVEWRQPSATSGSERAATVLRGELGSPRVLAFANPKGGVHKTTATVLAAATVGSVRGRGVLAWDDNELRGTLGLRAGSARHARTIRHLIGDLAHIEIKEGPELLDQLDDYLRHASDGSYDVLAGEESPRFAQRLDQFTVRRVLELLRRTHDVICVDTGNNVESPNWRTVMQAADQLVVTTVPREDAAFSADWMLDLLHEVGMGELADNAVTLISCPTPGRSELRADLERHFATRTRAVTVVPYDPILESGSSIEYHQLQPATREAWLSAAAVMLEPFAR
ncbi:AAA family ATPase [Salinispora cortesiana]|uniref:AAA family ATPase n=1 Tax=Salinispora cortesiana TaxID=1305843 RepID=UPI00046FBB67|nr:AAA family ATPase [Salinispora cortesiana]